MQPGVASPVFGRQHQSIFTLRRKRIKGRAERIVVLSSHQLSGEFGGNGGIRTLDTLFEYNALARRRLQPLGHVSGRAIRLAASPAPRKAPAAARRVNWRGACPALSGEVRLRPE